MSVDGQTNLRGDCVKTMFCCYSFALKEFLESRGFKYEVHGLNPSTLKKFYVFSITSKLSDALKEWAGNR